MKNFHKLLPLLALAGACTLGTACDDDDVDPNEDVNNKIQGDWEVESYTIDGVEQIQFTISRWDMEFTKQGPADGETEWDIVGGNGATSGGEFDYDIENAGTEIDIDGLEFDVDVDGDDLELSGNINGERWVIEAERD